MLNHYFRLLGRSQGLPLLPDLKPIFLLRSPFWFYLTYPVYFVQTFFLVTLYFSWFFLWKGYRVKTLILCNPYQGICFWPFLKLGWIKRCVFFAGDWLAGTKGPGRIWSKLGSDVVHPFFDRALAEMSELTVNVSPGVGPERVRYWGKSVVRKEIVLGPPFEYKRPASAPGLGNKIIFIGVVREDSGLDLILEVLPSLVQRLPLKLKIIGPPGAVRDVLQKKVAAKGLEQWVEFDGFFSRENLWDHVQDGFMGVNLITRPDSFSKFGLPAKMVDYLQYSMPILASPYVGWMVDWISENGLGQVILPNPREIEKGIEDLWNQKDVYEKRIKDFIGQHQGSRPSDWL